MAQDPRKFRFSSDYPLPWVVYKKEFNVSTTATGTTTTKFKHNLPYTPLLFGKVASNSNFSDAQEIGNSSSVGNNYMWLFADSTYVYFNLLATSGQTIYVRVMGFANPSYDGDIASLPTSSKFDLNTDEDYLGVYMQGTISSAYIEHNLPYIPQSRVWNIGDNYEYTGVYGTGQSGTRSTVHNTVYVQPAVVYVRNDGKYELINSATDKYLGFWAVYNPNNKSISSAGTTPSGYYQIYTEEA